MLSAAPRPGLLSATDTRGVGRAERRVWSGSRVGARRVVTSFHDLSGYVTIPRVTALRLSPDGSWLAAAVQTVGGEPKKYVTGIWRVPAARDEATARSGPPVRLTRSAEGEGAPQFPPHGSPLLGAQRPGPGGDGDVGQDKPALWLLPAGGGEARRIAAPPG